VGIVENNVKGLVFKRREDERGAHVGYARETNARVRLKEGRAANDRAGKTQGTHGACHCWCTVYSL
jgi:hypothetical protein